MFAPGCRNFLGFSVATVNNRLHAARTHLKQRRLAMVTDTFHANALLTILPTASAA